MKITAIIAEYNPFHNGHLKQLKIAKTETDADALVILMSGSFTQRGDMCIADKFTRANWAIQAGADMVLELPSVYSLSTAKNFAEGALKTLSLLGEFTLSFGTESEELDNLRMASEFMRSESKDTSNMIKKYLNQGFTVAKAKTMAISKNSPDVANMIMSPNNILAVEYMKAGLRYGDKVKFHNVPRKPDDMKKYASSTTIRKLLGEGKGVEKFVPNYVDLSQIINPTKANAVTIYALKSKTAEQLSELANISEGMENRISKSQFLTMEEFLDLTSKRYTRSTIKRIGASATIGLTKELVELAHNSKPYCTMLAVKKSKQKQLLSLLSQGDGYFFFKSSDCPKDNPIFPLISLDNKAADIQKLCY